MRGIDEVVEVKIRTIVAAQRHAARQVAVGRAEQLVDDPVQRHDAQAQVGDQTQVGGEGNVVVVRVIVAGDIDGVVGQNGDS